MWRFIIPRYVVNGGMECHDQEKLNAAEDKMRPRMHVMTET